MSGVERQERVVEASHRLSDMKAGEGEIPYFDMPELINTVGIIRSRAGLVRGNHYHPDQEQKLLVVQGRLISVSKDLDGPEEESPRIELVEEDRLIVTPPRVVHATISLTQSAYVNLVNGNRELEGYGIHTIPYPLITGEDAANYAATFGVKL